MSKKFDELDNIFNIATETISKEVDKSNVDDVVVTKNESSSDRIKDDIKKDYEYTRGNLYSIIEKGQEAINGILELAQETEQARAYEVAGQLIKSVSDATEKLMDLQKKLKDIEEVKQSSGPTNVTNALFVGSTAELSKLLKSQRQDNNK